LKAEYEEMEKFVKEWNLDSLPPPPPLSAPCPEESESNEPAAQSTEKGDTIAVRGSSGARMASGYGHGHRSLSKVRGDHCLGDHGER
jgi:hypothetical protein